MTGVPKCTTFEEGGEHNIHFSAERNCRSAIELREISIIALLTTFQACNIGSCALIAVEWVTLSTKRSSRNSYF